MPLLQEIQQVRSLDVVGRPLIDSIVSTTSQYSAPIIDPAAADAVTGITERVNTIALRVSDIELYPTNYLQGLGTMSVQNYTNVNITGGNVSNTIINNSTITNSTIGLTSLPIHDCVYHDQITLEQESTTSSGTSSLFGGATSISAIGQTFIPVNTKQMTHCEFTITKVGTPTDAVYVAVYDTTAGVPSGSPRIYSGLVQARDIIDGAAQAFFFPKYAPASNQGNWFIAGNIYAVVLFRTGGNDETNYYNIASDSNSTYAYGRGYQINNSVWQAIGGATASLKFATYYGQTIETDFILDQLSPANGILPIQNLGTGTLTPGAVLTVPASGNTGAWTTTPAFPSIQIGSTTNVVAEISGTTLSIDPTLVTSIDFNGLSIDDAGPIDTISPLTIYASTGGYFTALGFNGTTANRGITIPDLDGTLCLIGASQELTNKTYNGIAVLSQPTVSTVGFIFGYNSIAIATTDTEGGDNSELGFQVSKADGASSRTIALVPGGAGTISYTMPSATGTLATESFVSTSYVPYTGATSDVNLGARTITASLLKTTATFEAVDSTATIQWRGYSKVNTIFYLPNSATSDTLLGLSNVGITDDKIVQIDSADVGTGEYAKFTANGLESRSIAEVKSDLSLGSMAYETATNYITKATYDAYTILYADTDNTPTALSLSTHSIVGRAEAGIVKLEASEDRILGRKTGGNLGFLESTDIKTILSLGNVTNESKATMFTSPTFTGNAVLGTPASGTLTNCTGLPLAGVLFTQNYLNDQFNLYPQYDLLNLWCIGLDTTTTILDKGYAGRTVTAVNHAQIDTAQYKFGKSSILFDGTDDTLTLIDSSDWFFSTANFTIDCWLRCNGLPALNTAYGIVGQATNPNYWCYFLHNDGGTYKWRFKNYVNGVGNSIDVYVTATILTATWTHIAVVRNGNNFYFFQDGVQIGTTQTSSGAVTDSSGVLTIGQDIVQTGTYTNGWMQNLRITNRARWTSNFTPPIA